MSEPRLYFYEVVPAGSNNAPTEVPILDFRATDGLAIKAGENSATRTIQIWNAPNSNSGLSAPPSGSSGAGAQGTAGTVPGTAFWTNTNTEGVSQASAVDLVTRDFTSPARGTGIVNGIVLPANVGGDVVQGTWLNVHNASSTDTEVANATTGKYVGYIGATERKAPLPNIAASGLISVRLYLHTPGDAVAGERNFYIRLSYSFQ